MRDTNGHTTSLPNEKYIIMYVDKNSANPAQNLEFILSLMLVSELPKLSSSYMVYKTYKSEPVSTSGVMRLLMEFLITIAVWDLIPPNT